MTVQTDGVKASRAQIVLAFAAVYIIWGSTYLAIRFAIETLPPFLMAATRFLTAGTILYAWQRATGRPRPVTVEWRSALIIGGLLIGVGNGAVVWAELRIPSGIAALVVAVVPCWLVVIDWLWGKGERPTLRIVAGLLLGFGGIALLMGPVESGSGVDPLGVIAVIAATLAWASGSIYSRSAPLPKSQLLASGMEMLCGGALLLVFALLIGETRSVNFDAMSTRSVLALLYLIVFGSLVAYSAYVWLLQVVKPAIVSTYAYVNPVVAVLLGWAMAGEEMSPRMGLAALVILTGVVLISTKKRQAA